MKRIHTADLLAFTIDWLNTARQLQHDPNYCRLAVSMAKRWNKGETTERIIETARSVLSRVHDIEYRLSEVRQ